MTTIASMAPGPCRHALRAPPGRQAQFGQFGVHGARGAAGLGQRVPALEAEALVHPALHGVAQRSAGRR
jgi:hypothetical protein